MALPSIRPAGLEIARLTAADDLQGFASDDLDLDAFLQSDALRLQERAVIQVSLARYEGELAGYVALLADIVILQTGERKKLKLGYEDPPPVPAVKIGRLAVSADFRKRYRGLGRAMVAFSFNTALQVSRDVGCRLLTVDAYAQSVAFYELLGFIANKGKEYRERETVSMRLDLHAAPLPAWLVS